MPLEEKDTVKNSLCHEKYQKSNDGLLKTSFCVNVENFEYSTYRTFLNQNQNYH